MAAQWLRFCCSGLQADIGLGLDFTANSFQTGAAALLGSAKAMGVMDNASTTADTASAHALVAVVR
jgi:hypothetical protein